MGTIALSAIGVDTADKALIVDVGWDLRVPNLVFAS